MAAITRPRFEKKRHVIFSGKIEIFLFITKEPAKKSSVNRAAKIFKTKVMTSVGRDIIQSYFIEKLASEIISKWMI